MPKSLFIEDVFLEFHQLVAQDKIVTQPNDISAINSFCRAIVNGTGLTQNQANFLLKILQKYKNQAKLSNLNYEDEISFPRWQNDFRVLDLSRKIFVELDQNNNLSVCLQFPFQLKKEFEEEFLSTPSLNQYSSWDSNRRIKKLDLYRFNLIHLHNFATKHSFSIDESFLHALAQFEEIWQNSENVLPFSTIINNQVAIVNSIEETDQYWDQHSNGNIINDLVLAKSMGFPLNKKPENYIETLASTSSNSFWIKNIDNFVNLIQNVSGKICIVLDRAVNSFPWLEAFANAVERAGIPSSEVKVCFRSDKNENTNINEWVKNKGFGGKVEEGRILIFKHSPAKWLFKEQHTVAILATDNLYQPNSHMTRHWFNSHPCVLYVSEVKPTIKDTKIVEL
jgi:uncharacterized protein YozE (UPF0346 family)